MNDHVKKNRSKVITLASSIVFAAFVFLIFAIVLSIPTCMLVSSQKEKIFDSIKVGDTKESVISVLGNPTEIQMTKPASDQYASDCQGECTERLRYYFSLCLGLNEWHVDIDKNGKVIQKAHLVSP